MTTGSSLVPPDLATLALRLQGPFPWTMNQQEVESERGHGYDGSGLQGWPLWRALWKEGPRGEGLPVGSRWKESVKQLVAANGQLEEVGEWVEGGS